MGLMQKTFEKYHQRKQALDASTNPYADGIAWIEGAYVPIAEARVPILDEGFLHSDLTYDVPSVWDGRFFRLDDHLSRFEASLEKLRLKWPLPRDEVRDKLIEMVSLSGIRDAYVEVIVTRGFKFVRYHKDEEHPNHLYMLVLPYIFQLPPELHATGGAAMITRTVRRIPPGAIDPTVKNLQWGDFIRGVQEVGDRGARYPILTDGDGNLAEGAGNNVVVIKDGGLYTPSRGVLEGVTRKSVMEIAQKIGVPVHLDYVPVELAYQADELFLCTTAGGVMPMTSLDGKPVGDGKVGPITSRIWDEYIRMRYDPQHSFEVTYKD